MPGQSIFTPQFGVTGKQRDMALLDCWVSLRFDHALTTMQIPTNCEIFWIAFDRFIFLANVRNCIPSIVPSKFKQTKLPLSGGYKQSFLTNLTGNQQKCKVLHSEGYLISNHKDLSWGCTIAHWRYIDKLFLLWAQKDVTKWGKFQIMSQKLDVAKFKLSY